MPELAWRSHQAIIEDTLLRAELVRLIEKCFRGCIGYEKIDYVDSDFEDTHTQLKTTLLLYDRFRITWKLNKEGECVHDIERDFLHDLMEGIKIYPTYKDGADYWITLQKGELLLYIWFRRYLLL